MKYYQTYYINNKQKINKKHIKYYQKNKMDLIKKHKIYKLENREDILKKDKIYRLNHHGDGARRMREYRERLRNKLLEIYGDCCDCCGEKEKLFLSIDHINGGGTKHKAKYSNPNKMYKAIIKESDKTKYRILCMNCNHGRQRNGGICPHKQNIK